MNVLMVLSDNTYPPDIRVKKEASTLLDNGFKVNLISKGIKNQKENENVDGVQVFRKKFLFLEKKNIGSILYQFLYRYIIFFSIIRLSKQKKISMLHVHDLPFALATCFAGKLLGIPVIFDMHEDYVEMVHWSVKYLKGFKKILNIFLSNILSIEEKICLSLSHKIIVVVEEEIDRLKKLKVPENKIVVISNTELSKDLSSILRNIDKKRYQDKFIISYIGGFSYHRGIDTLIRSMKYITESIPNAHLILVGDGLIKSELQDICRDLGIKNYVTFTGHVSFEKAMEYIQISDICSIPYHSSRQTEKSFPHKLSQYMYFEKPILVSNVKSLKRIINENKCGLIFKSGDPKDLAKKIIDAVNNDELSDFGKNARKAFDEKYNWDRTSNDLLKLYQKVSMESN